MEVIYDGPVCPRCSNTHYTKVTYGSSEYKKCVECGRTSSVKDGELTEPEGS
jgi:transposase-like protein